MWKIIISLVALVVCAHAHQYSTRLHPRLVGMEGISPSIVGGSDAQPGQFPYLVSIQLELTTNTSSVHLHNCGGSILNEYWILTAGHCAVGIPNYENYLLIVAGEHDLGTEEGTEQRVRVERLVVHPDYPDEPVVAPNDIALMKLREPLVFNERVQPIALPEAETIPTGNSTLCGWGAIGGSLLFPKMPDVLQTAELPLLDYGDCKALYNDSPLAETNLCTGPLEGGESACQGDSGGPLVQYGENMTQFGETVNNGTVNNVTVIGIVSWGMWPCASPNSPSVFTRVSGFLDFIDDGMNSK